MYCSIEEAWPQYNKNYNNYHSINNRTFDNYNTITNNPLQLNNSNQQIEQFNNQPNFNNIIPTNNTEKLIENFTNENDTTKNNNYFTLDNQTKEIIIIFLIGLLIILIFNLLCK